MTDEEMLYRYAMRKGFRFTYTEDENFISIMVFTDKTDTILSYTWDKTNGKILYLRVDDKRYENVENALQDFDDYELLRENQSLY
jgi:hypothetical protein